MRAIINPIFMLTVAVVAGCAQVERLKPAPLPKTPSVEHANAVRAIDSWRVGGRVAVQRADTGFSGALDWRQDKQSFDLRISAPLNGGTFALQQTAGSVRLLTPKGEIYTATSAQALMTEHLGWSLPVQGAAYWLRGVPAPGSAVVAENLDEFGRWTDFAQDGWRISVLDYFVDQKPVLPRKLFMTRDDLKVKVVVKSWELP